VLEDGEPGPQISPTAIPSPSHTSPWSVARALILAGALGVVLFGVWTADPPSETARSRLATVVALADHGTWYIDRPAGLPRITFEKHTIDKVKTGNRLISSKPPVLSLAMTAEYIALRALLGWDLNNKEDLSRIVSAMSLTFSGIPYLLVLFFFEKTAALFQLPMRSRALALAGLAFGTQLWGFSTHINNHLPAVALLTAALYFALGLTSGRLTPRPWRFALFGLCGSLAITIDFPSGVFVTIMGVFLLTRFPKRTLIWSAIAALPALAVHAGVMMAITGSPLPVQMHEEMYFYESSYWRNPRGVDALNEPKGTYLFHMTFGRAGIFLLYPITFLGVLSAFSTSARKDPLFRPLLITGIAGFVVLTIYYAMSTNNYGGAAYGFRWYITAMPILMLIAAHYMAQFTKYWQWLIVILLTAVSIFSGWQCYSHPWEVDAEWTTRIFGSSR